VQAGYDLRTDVGFENPCFQMPLFGRSKNQDYQKAARMLHDGKANDAIAELRSIIEKEPGHVNSHVTLAVALMQVQEQPTRDSPQTIEALAHLETAAKLDLKDPIPYFNMGVMLRSLGQREESLVAFEKALEREDRQPLALANMAEINYELERWDEAIRLARLALIRDPGLESSMGWVRVAMRKAGLLDHDGNVIQRPE
jgi:tetratricopeptide (TPR) repeat protein